MASVFDSGALCRLERARTIELHVYGRVWGLLGASGEKESTH
jgi:hypothetical protein